MNLHGVEVDCRGKSRECISIMEAIFSPSITDGEKLVVLNHLKICQNCLTFALSHIKYCEKGVEASKEIEKKNPKRPVIKCLPRAIMNGYKDGMKFWCPYCKTWHYHGRGDGHRTAHCCDTSDSRHYEKPFYKDGYIIKLMSKKELRQIRKEIDAYLSKPLIHAQPTVEVRLNAE